MTLVLASSCKHVFVKDLLAQMIKMLDNVFVDPKNQIARKFVRINGLRWYYFRCVICCIFVCVICYIFVYFRKDQIYILAVGTEQNKILMQ